MATNIISAILAESPLKINNGSSDVAKNLKIVRVTTKFNSAPMRHMREDGATIVDARIIQPATVNIEAFSPDEGTATQIGTILSDRQNLYSIVSRGISISNVMAEYAQIGQQPDVMSAIPIRLGFRQVIMKTSQQTIKAQSADASLMDRGMTIINTTTSTVQNLYDKVKGAF